MPDSSGGTDRPENATVASLSAANEMSDAEIRLWLDAAAALRSRVAAYIRRTTRDRDEVADLLAETWATAWCEHGDSTTVLPDEALLIGHARRAATRWKRAHRRELPVSDAGHLSNVAPDSERVQDEVDDDFLRTLACIRELPQQQFYAVCFRQLRGAKFEAVAAALGCSVSAAKTHYWRGIAVLRRRRAELSASELNAM